MRVRNRNAATRRWRTVVAAQCAVLSVAVASCMGGSATPAGSGGAPGSGASGGVGVSTGGSGSGGSAPATGGASGTGSSGGSGSGGASSSDGGSAGGAAASGGNGVGGDAAGGRGGGAGSSGGGGASATGGRGGGGGVAATGGAGGAPAAGITKDGEVRLTTAGLTLVSYGGYLNGESFQQDGILSHNGYQYTAFWNTARHVVLARRMLPTGAWAAIEFTDYTNTESDAHNTISLGICPGDGTLHLSFDHHGSVLHYRKSVANLVTTPATATWAATSFGAVSSALVGTTAVNMVTYPRFITEPGGAKMLLELRIGASGSGDEHLWEYDSVTHAWTALGKFINGMTANVNGYPHGLSYTRGGTRLHVSWCWRETPDATTNHDLLYAYSDDHGRTWRNNGGTAVATTGTSFLAPGTSGIKVWTINQNRGLINQEHMAVDGAGRVHVLLSHMPDAQADDANFDSARGKGQWFHYWRNAAGTWARASIGVNTIAAFRGKLAISAAGNIYAVLPDLRIAGSSAASNFATWTTLNTTDAGRFFSDPLIDTVRLDSEDKLSVVYGQKSSPNIYVLDYTLK